MAQVLPAELLHAQYAEEVLEFLRRAFGRIVIAVFEERVFPGALKEVVLLCANDFGAGGKAEVELISFEDVSDIDLGAIGEKPKTATPTLGPGQLLGQLLPASTQALLDKLARSHEVGRLETVASVDIGIVTGANDFFLLSREEARGLSPTLLRPAVSKAAHVSGARVTSEDLQALLDQGRSALMFVASDQTDPKAVRTAQQHIRAGEARGLHRRYKCRVRDPWWGLPIPNAGVPDLLLTYCSNDFPRLALNAAEVLQTNTIHGVNAKPGVDPAALAAGFYNSLTLLSAELVGRSYGGGVLKLEPTEAEALLVPAMSPELFDLLPEVDRAVRAGEPDLALDLVDPVVLGPLGLATEDVSALRTARERLRARRKRRGAPAR